MKIFHSLCIGDSYTIGEGVPLHEGFPYQLTQLLRNKGYKFAAPEIVAKTGWTSFELLEHLNSIRLNEKYDFVTLLIGVNNQYRNLSSEEFKNDFEILLKKAIHFADGNLNNVIVLSIPDWGVTPFAKERDATQIASEIDTFNGVCELAAQKFQVNYLAVTDDTRKAISDATLLTNDGLHYSGKEHSIWAVKVCNIILNNLKNTSATSL
ncbi:MAG: SGNH/GDSL hydrolase family protein [Chitinophagaceae bacterium]